MKKNNSGSFNKGLIEVEAVPGGTGLLFYSPRFFHQAGFRCTK